MIHTDRLHKILYATDASVYREMPAGVLIPRDFEEVRQLILKLGAEGGSLIPRGAGTSLAGQVVGAGIVVDSSRHLNKIKDFNKDELWVWVEPGVVRDELNAFLKPHGLFFAPETSTSNRCTIGGMLGNNACGAHSLVYGSTRDHILEAKVLLSDGKETLFKALDASELAQKCRLQDVEGAVYRFIHGILNDTALQEEIQREYPHPSLRRRNTGYALDALGPTDALSPMLPNLCKLLAGSEGTLAYVTALKLSLCPLPPAHTGLLCVHCTRLEEAFDANLSILAQAPQAVELMDHHILERAAANPLQQQNRFFVQGAPAAILVAEFSCHSPQALQAALSKTEAALRTKGLGYAYIPVLGPDMARVWALRKAGLGLLSNIPGSAKPVSLIEDTAVAPELLPAYLRDFGVLMQKHGLSCVYHAHIGSGELHLRPVLDLKKSADRKRFVTLGREVALLVKQYRGSLSGEHGDGRLRGPYIPLMYSPAIMDAFCRLKQAFDPKNIFNPGKILDVPPIDQALRYEADEEAPHWKTTFDFSAQQGLLSAIEQCNGSGDCRKSRVFEGGMCPSFRAIGDEKDSPRGRANVLRELLSRPNGPRRFSQPEILEVLDSCLSCKACRTECPSNVDLTRWKAEILQQAYQERGVPLRVWLVGIFDKIQQLGMLWPWFYNAVAQHPLLGRWAKKLAGFTLERPLPLLAPRSLKSWLRAYKQEGVLEKQVWLFADEFSNRNDVAVGQAAVKLLNRLGYSVQIPAHKESGRAAFSKGLLQRARKLAARNVALLSPVVSAERPLIGLEPSAILSFRDEYVDLLGAPTSALAPHCLMLDEFLMRENIDWSRIWPQDSPARSVILHGHCHQMALAKIESLEALLRSIPNLKLQRTPAGCCGMAGAFGYQQQHYALSQQIGEQALFPLVRQASEASYIVAPGTSCRQQISQGTGRKVLHPAEFLWQMTGH